MVDSIITEKGLHVFHERVIRLSVRPFGVAHDAVRSARQHVRVRRLEEQIRAGHQDADHPNDTCDAQRGPFAHSRPQRTHDRHVPGKWAQNHARV